MTLTQEDIDKACILYPEICRDYKEKEDNYNSIKEQYDDSKPSDSNYNELKIQLDDAKTQYEFSREQYDKMLQEYQTIINQSNDVNDTTENI